MIKSFFMFKIYSWFIEPNIGYEITYSFVVGVMFLYSIFVTNVNVNSQYENEDSELILKPIVVLLVEFFIFGASYGVFLWLKYL